MDVRKAMWIFIITTFFITVSDRLLFVIFPTYLIEKNFSATEIGLIFSAATLILVVLRTFIGKLSDRYGRKIVMSAGLLVDSLSSAIYPFVSRLSEFAVVKGLEEISTTLIQSVQDSMQADSFSKSERPRYLITLGKAYTLSRAITAVLGILITTYLTLVYGFYIAAAATFIAFLVFFLLYKEERIKVKHEKSQTFRYSRRLNSIAVIGFLTSFVFGIMYFPAFFVLGEKYLGLGANAIFLLFLFGYIISAFIIHFAEKRTKNFGTRRIMVGTTIAFALFSFFYLFSNLVLFSVAAIGIAVAYYVWRIAYKTVVMDAAKPSERGEQLGFVQTMQGVGDVVGPLAGGLLADFYAIQAPFAVGGVIYLLAALLILKTL
jgi:DHA1 family multidrug resistance protein-like MFS transporter